MRYNFELLKSDILDEIAKIDKIASAFNEIESKLKLDDDLVTPYDRGAIGYLLHNFYSGCENIFRSIGRFFENDLEPQSWHRDLLKRMKISIEGYRPRVIDDALFILLDDFRAFRHKFRHSYSFETRLGKRKTGGGEASSNRRIAQDSNPTVSGSIRGHRYGNGLGLKDGSRAEALQSSLYERRPDKGARGRAGMFRGRCAPKGQRQVIAQISLRSARDSF